MEQPAHYVCILRSSWSHELQVASSSSALSDEQYKILFFHSWSYVPDRCKAFFKTEPCLILQFDASRNDVSSCRPARFQLLKTLLIIIKQLTCKRYSTQTARCLKMKTKYIVVTGKNISSNRTHIFVNRGTKESQWTNGSMIKVINAVMDGTIHIRGESQLYCVPAIH